MARKGFKGTGSTLGNQTAAPVATSSSSGDIVLEWDAATITTLNQLRAGVEAILLQIKGTSLLTN